MAFHVYIKTGGNALNSLWVGGGGVYCLNIALEVKTVAAFRGEEV